MNSAFGVVMRKERAKIIFITVLSLVYLSWLHATFTFADPDAFYHARLSALMIEQGPVLNFDWLPFTGLADYYTDHHFWFHVLLAPVTVILSPWLALKIFSVVVSVLFFVFFYIFLLSQRVKSAWFFTLVLLVNYPFVFRLSLGKTLPLVLIFLLLGFYFFQQKYKLGVFIMSWLTVWLYGGWPLFVVFLVSYAMLAAKKDNQNILSFPWLQLASGVVVGLVVNPYFPNNLKFYWQQVWHIALINYQDKIGVGAEWFPYKLEILANDLGLAGVVFLVILIGVVYFLEKISTTTIWLWLWLFVFLALTLKSQRYVEYFVPFLVLWSALAWRDIEGGSILTNIWRKLRSNKWQLYSSQLAVVLVLALALGQSAVRIRQEFEQGFTIDAFQESAQFLAENTKPGEVVFHSDWGIFPMLWYYNQNNRYIVGLDPTFLYNKDRQRYYEWVYITSGRLKQISKIVNENFQSRYVLIDRRQSAMLDNFQQADWQIIYQDQYAAILTNSK